jgi:K+-sensing histidine kinase KdpD
MPSGYTIALIVFALALGVRELLDPYIKIPFVTLFPAMVVCSLVGGRLAGILVAGGGGIIAWYLWLPPRGTFALEWPIGHLTILLYVLTSTILLLLTRGLNETLRELEKERDLSAELFRELQHRTANNLQNVSALLRQNRDAIRRDPIKAAEVIDSAERRFEIMSRINRRLYSPEMQDVEVTPSLETL